MSDTALALRNDTCIAQRNDVRVEDFLPLMSVAQAVERKGMINQFIGKVLTEGIDGDYGVIPGSKKKVLLKPGAEKLCSIFGLSPTYTVETIIEDWCGTEHDGEPLFFYAYRCQLSRGGKFMGEAIGSCNSWESKYRYRWVPEDVARQRPDFESLPKRGGQKTMFEPNFALDKAETTGKYGKPAEYWQKWRAAAEAGEAKPGKKMMGAKEFAGYFWTTDETQYRIPNPEVADIVNTCQKIAQKRALVSCVLVVTNCSDSFTPDMEDFVDVGGSPAPTPPAQHEPDTEPPTTQRKITLPSGRPVPEELFEMLWRIQHDPDHFADACRLMEKDLSAHGDQGTICYNNIADAFEAKMKKLKRGPKVGECQDAVLDLFIGLKSFPEVVA